MQICTNALLVFELGSLDVVGSKCRARCIGRVHGGLAKERSRTYLVLLVDVFRANVPIFVEGDEIECAEGV